MMTWSAIFSASFISGLLGSAIGYAVVKHEKSKKINDLTGGFSPIFPKQCLTLSEHDENHLEITMANKPVWFAMPSEYRRKDIEMFVIVPVGKDRLSFPEPFNDLVVDSTSVKKPISERGYYCANDGKDAVNE